jgi:DNA anti-recombination protein RmuC
MNDSESRPATGLLVRTLKSIGHLTSQETRTGQVFAKAERGLSQAIDRVTGSSTYLTVSGALLRRGALLRSRRAAMLEKTLHSLRMPTSTEVDDMRDQVRRLGDQVEALGSQLERVARLLEREQAAAPAEPPSLPEAPAAEPARLKARGARR